MIRIWQLIRDVYDLVRPFGRRKIARVCAAVLFNAIMQVIGVASVFPFLAVAADPAAFRATRIGGWATALAPGLDDRELVVAAGVLSIVMLVLSNVTSVVTEHARATYAHRFGHWMRIRLLSHILAQPYAYFLQTNTALLTKKVVGDVMQFVSGVLLPLLEAATRGLIVVMLGLTLLIYNPAITITVLAVLSLFYWACFQFIGRRAREISKTVKGANRGSYFAISQAFSVVKPMLAADAQQFFVDRVAEHSAEHARVAPRTTLYGHSPRYLLEPVAYGGLIIWVIVTIVRGGDLATLIPSVGLVAMIGYRMMPALQLFFAQATQVSANLHALEELQDEFADVRGTAMLPKLAEPLDWTRSIEFRNVSFRYDGSDRLVLDDVTFSIPRGAHVGVVGPTGSGKSTLVDLLLGLLSPTSGEIDVDGKKLTVDQLPNWRAAIGYVPQETVLLDGTVEENIAFGVEPGAIDRNRIVEAVKTAQIHDFIEQELPNGFSTAVGERGVRLSGGQRQRLGLARALYRRPSVLVLDEATSALDSKTESALVSAIDSLPAEITVIAIAHRDSTLSGSDFVLRIHEGRIEKATAVGGDRSAIAPAAR